MANSAAPAKRRRSSSSPAIARMIKTPTTMMASRTGLSARPRVSLPKLTSEAGSRLMISSPTAGTGEPAGATIHAASPAIPRPARPATAQRGLAHHRVARAASRSSRLCTSHPAPLRLFEQRTGAYVSITLFWSCSRIARMDPPTSSSLAEEKAPLLLLLSTAGARLPTLAAVRCQYAAGLR